MTKEEFMKKAAETFDWAPGWDAIDQEFSRLYPNQKPMHFDADDKCEFIEFFSPACVIFGGKDLMTCPCDVLREFFSDGEI